MTSVLIADPFKPSVVMTSEICKDKFLGVQVVVSGSGHEALEAVAKQPFDLIIVDFDLPDVDGPTLIRHLRNMYTGPILMTAYPEEIVDIAVAEELFAFNDASGWIRKPIKADDLQVKVNAFINEGKRIYRRFNLQMPATIKVENQKKNTKSKTTSIKARLLNLGLGGGLVELPKDAQIKKGEPVAVQLNLGSLEPVTIEVAVANLSSPKSSKKKVTKKTVGSKKKTASKEISKKTEILQLDNLPKSLNRIKAHIVWADTDKGCAGLYFDRLTKSHEATLSNLLRQVYSKEVLAPV